jgi:hypothetical protein
MLRNFTVRRNVVVQATLLLAAVVLLTAIDRPSDDVLAERAKYVANLEPSAQQELLRKFEQFESLTPEEQQRLRKLEADITADPNSKRLRQVLERYHEWLKTITPAQRAKLASLPPRERVEAVEDLHREQRDAQRLEPLTRDDLRHIRRWLEELVERHREELLAGMSQRSRQWYERQTDADAKEMTLVFQLFGRRRGRTEDNSKITDADLDRLRERLSASAQAELAKVNTPDEQRQIVRNWVFASLRRSSAWQRERRGNPVVGEELLRFLQTEVPPVEREQLLKKPREEMLQELRRMYFERSGFSRGSFSGRPGEGRGERPRRGDGPREDDRRPSDSSRPAAPSDSPVSDSADAPQKPSS